MAKAKGDSSMLIKQKKLEDAYNFVLQDPRDMVRAKLPKPQFPVMEAYIPRLTASHGGVTVIGWLSRRHLNIPHSER
ncbi:hypothetical protein DP116_22580 [Brasilonema bromeliae SPC951]|uniref:Uncharacterized protein n=2 Tax=Bromeliae group (in: Brasilonema) TaxID=3398495 RepID=A0ABX1PC91_9CYAN|nr:hypothetical protein [Brasilonema bromeliae SPC951]